MPALRTLRIVAQDPTVKGPDGRVLTEKVDVAYERLDAGPVGHRVRVVSFDAVRREVYPAVDIGSRDATDGFEDDSFVNDRAFHAQNVYAIVMRLLARFEAALGRQVPWGFDGHQLYLAPHALAQANAFYSREARGLLFGAFTAKSGAHVFTCLSHDIVAHETTHALIDGLRSGYLLPSGPDQAAFHEGLADTVALLSVFSMREVVAKLLLAKRECRGAKAGSIKVGCLDRDSLCATALLGLAEQFGQETSGFRSEALRRAVEAPPSPGALRSTDYEDRYKRGEILTSAILRAFVAVWCARLEEWIREAGETVRVQRVAEDGADAAQHLLTMCIRALDYCPPVELTFDDYLSALLTSDFELVPSDGRYGYRAKLLLEFAGWGIEPASKKVTGDRAGTWEPPDEAAKLCYGGSHREELERDPDAVWRFLWDNQAILRIYPPAYTRVTSVRPCVRVAPDGFTLRETVAEYVQYLEITAAELARLGVARPPGLADHARIRLPGGGVLVFDDYGRLKYHIRQRLDDWPRQGKRLEYLVRNEIGDAQTGYGFTDSAARGMRYSRHRALRPASGGWGGGANG